MILIGYVLESIVISFWYMLIVKKEVRAKVNDADRVLRRTINLLVQYKSIIKNNILIKVNYRQEKRKGIDIIKNRVGNLILINAKLGFFLFINPLVTNIWIKCKDNAISVIVYMILIICLLVMQLKENTQNYIEVLERYIKQVIIPLEKCPRLIEIEEDEIINVQWTTKNKKAVLLIIILGIATFVLFIWGERYFQQNKKVKGLVCIFAVFFRVIDYVKNRLTKRKKEKSVVFVSVEYNIIREEVENICALLGIHSVKFIVIDEKRVNAYSRMNDDGIWEVSVTSQFITVLRKMLLEEKNNEKNVVISIAEVKRIFLATLVHELGHVFYRDNISEKRRMLLSVLICLALQFMALLLLIFSAKSLFFAGVSCILLWVEWIFGSIMCDIRYWGQIAEFKADRMIAKYVEGGTEAFVYFWGDDERIQIEEESTQNINKENFIYKYYKRNLEVEKHPSMKYRRKLMEERTEWKWWEYFEYVLVIRKWRRKGLGWNGVLKVTRI